jgi:hypothetical protein
MAEVTKETEEIYYQQREDRIHFIKPVYHNLGHLASETLQVGPLICSSQWTMENSIGNLTATIKSDVRPYMNLSEKATVRAQVNALKSMVPSLLDPDYGKESYIAPTARDLGDKYVLLHPTAPTAQSLEDSENRALADYLGEEEVSSHAVHWGRLRLPNGQIACSYWKEKRQTQGLRTARNVKVR